MATKQTAITIRTVGVDEDEPAAAFPIPGMLIGWPQAAQLPAVPAYRSATLVRLPQ
jgi:hypothetical protein